MLFRPARRLSRISRKRVREVLPAVLLMPARRSASLAGGRFELGFMDAMRTSALRPRAPLGAFSGKEHKLTTEFMVLSAAIGKPPIMPPAPIGSRSLPKFSEVRAWMGRPREEHRHVQQDKFDRHRDGRRHRHGFRGPMPSRSQTSLSASVSLPISVSL